MNLDQNAKATFYQYRLLKKSVYPKILTRLALILPLLVLILEIILWGPLSLVYFVLAAPICLWIQFVICRSVLIISSRNDHRKWHFIWRLPWIGYMPDQHIRYTIFRTTLFHYTWIGLCIIAILFPWSPSSLTVSLLLWHVWLLVPRWFTFTALQKQRKDGLIKFNEQDLSYYTQ